MKNYIVLFIMVSHFSLSAKPKHEIGIGVGVINYNYIDKDYQIYRMNKKYYSLGGLFANGNHKDSMLMFIVPNLIYKKNVVSTPIFYYIFLFKEKYGIRFNANVLQEKSTLPTFYTLPDCWGVSIDTIENYKIKSTIVNLSLGFQYYVINKKRFNVYPFFDALLRYDNTKTSHIYISEYFTQYRSHKSISKDHYIKLGIGSKISIHKKLSVSAEVAGQFYVEYPKNYSISLLNRLSLNYTF